MKPHFLFDDQASMHLHLRAADNASMVILLLVLCVGGDEIELYLWVRGVGWDGL